MQYFTGFEFYSYFFLKNMLTNLDLCVIINLTNQIN